MVTSSNQKKRKEEEEEEDAGWVTRRLFSGVEKMDRPKRNKQDDALLMN